MIRTEIVNSNAPALTGVRKSVRRPHVTTQQELAGFNEHRLALATASSRWREALDDENHIRFVEGVLIEGLRGEVAGAIRDVPRDTAAFLEWFEGLLDRGEGQHDPLFPWLAESATLEQMRWFLRQEAAGEMGFDDLVALTQIKLPARPKLGMARNYWDEMGRGKEVGMHGPMLSRLVSHLKLEPTVQTTVTEALTLANVMLAFALNRRYCYQSIGALGVIELTAPSRVVQVAHGLRRLGLSAKQRVYFDLHGVVDLRHSMEWNREVIGPLIEHDPDCAPHIAEGALIRLACGARCFARYRKELWSTPQLVAGASSHTRAITS